jgi:ligand-binding sensor domain-containing protein
MEYRLLVIVLLILSFSGQVTAQLRKYSYQQLTEEDGLPQNFVYGLIQDDRGFLWAGSGTGLSRYDGFEIKNFSKQDGLSGDFVTSSFKLRSGNLVFGHNQGGVTIFDGLKFKALLADTLNTKVVSITEDGDHNLWVATQSGGLTFIGKDRKTISGVNPPEIKDQIINTIFMHKHLLWVGTQEGLFIFRSSGSELTLVNNNLLPPYTEVASILMHHEDSSLFWIGTASQGLYLAQNMTAADRIVEVRRIVLPEFVNDVIQSIDQHLDGDLWIGTRQHGIIHLNIGKNGRSIFKINTFSKKSGFPVTSVNKLVVDRQGQVWAGTMGDGVIKILKEFFTYFPFGEKYGVSDVRSIAEISSGYLVGTDKGLLKISFDQESGEYEVESVASLKGQSVLSLFTDRRNQTWVGTEYQGVFIFAHGSNTIHPVVVGETKNMVKARLFEEDKKGNIWISAMAEGVYVLDSDKKLVNHLTTAKRFIHNDIFAIKADSKGNIWFGTYGAGLAMMKPEGTLIYISKQGSIRARDINDITEDNFGNIWIATEGEGFFKYADSLFTQVGSGENLVTPFIKGIQYDPQGRIWYSYRKGVGYYDLESSKKSHFTVQDGLIAGEAYSSTIMVDSKSNKWFCNDYGVTLFENDTIRNNRRQLETYLTGIRIFFKDYPLQFSEGDAMMGSMVNRLPAVELSHEENHLTFDFAAIELNRTGKIYYRHLLQEYDNEWTPPSTSNSITYTNLDPGNYTLKIQATDDLGSWVDPVTEYSFSIVPPYWKQTWFYLLQIVSVLTLFTLTYLIGKRGIARKRFVLRLMLFSSFFITLEYVENFIDPLVSNFFGGAPVFRFFLNFILALLLLPVESIITHWLMGEERKLAKSASEKISEPVVEEPLIVEEVKAGE